MLIQGELELREEGEKLEVPEQVLLSKGQCGDLGEQSEARALIGEQGEIMLSGEAGLGGEGLARGFGSSTGDIGEGDLDSLFSLWLVLRFLFFRELEIARGEIVMWVETPAASGVPRSSLSLAPDSTSSSTLSSRK